MKFRDTQLSGMAPFLKSSPEPSYEIPPIDKFTGTPELMNGSNTKHIFLMGYSL
jgi:hypothetical protein